MKDNAKRGKGRLKTVVSWRFATLWIPTKNHYGFGFGLWRNDMNEDGKEIIWTLAIGWITIYARKANAALTGGPDGPALRGDGRAHPVKRPCPEGALCAPRGGAANEVSAASRARSARDAGLCLPQTREKGKDER